MPNLPSRSNTEIIAADSCWKLWINCSTSDKFCYILIHTLAQKSCEDICNTILSIHVLTIYDATSKAGTKAAAIKANYHSLASFGINRRPNFKKYL